MIKRNIKGNAGISLFVAVIVTSVALIMSLAIANIALKEVVLTQASRDSQAAFYAANSGIECALFEDFRKSVFTIEPVGGEELNCSEQNVPVTMDSSCSDEQCTPGFQCHCWIGEVGNNDEIYLDSSPSGNNGPCFLLKAIKEEGTDDDGEEFIRTIIESRGYNICDPSSPRRVERALRVEY